MKKNNKGFFLAETIVVLALVTTVMAFVYPNVSKLYDNYNSRILYYDQPQDVLLLKEIYNTYKDKIEDQTKGKCGTIENFSGVKRFSGGELISDNLSDDSNGGIRLYQRDTIRDTISSKNYFTNKLDNDTTNDGIGIVNSFSNDQLNLKDDFGLVRLYLTGYMTNVSAGNYNFNRYLKRLRKVTNDPYSYRLIGVFYSDGQHRFASIKLTLDEYCAIE